MIDNKGLVSIGTYINYYIQFVDGEIKVTGVRLRVDTSLGETYFEGTFTVQVFETVSTGVLRSGDGVSGLQNDPLTSRLT